MQPIIIAEIGVNHNNDSNILHDLVKGAATAQADFVKFQRFISSEEISASAPLAEYQKEESSSYSSQLEMAQQLEMSDDLLLYGIELCKKYKIAPLCSAFELKSLNYISTILNMKSIKIPSPEITNIPFLCTAAKLFDDVILSTGASSIADIDNAISQLRDSNPMVNITLLHCVSEYPAPFSSLNLKAIQTMKSAFQLPVGFSDHSEGTFGAFAALSMGACMLEKHITLDQSLPGPDHKASATIDDLTEICRFANLLPSMSGSGLKQVTNAEYKNKCLIRKSIYLNIDVLHAGSVIEERHIACKRPYSDHLVQPCDYYALLGRTLKSTLYMDSGITWSDVE